MSRSLQILPQLFQWHYLAVHTTDLCQNYFLAENCSKRTHFVVYLNTAHLLQIISFYFRVVFEAFFNGVWFNASFSYTSLLEDFALVFVPKIYDIDSANTRALFNVDLRIHFTTDKGQKRTGPSPSSLLSRQELNFVSEIR